MGPEALQKPVFLELPVLCGGALRHPILHPAVDVKRTAVGVGRADKSAPDVIRARTGQHRCWRAILISKLSGFHR